MLFRFIVESCPIKRSSIFETRNAPTRTKISLTIYGKVVMLILVLKLTSLNITAKIEAIDNVNPSIIVYRL